MKFKNLKIFLDSPTFTTWINYVIILGHGLIVTPLTLKKFGDVQYSFWVMLQTLLAFSVLADSGFGHTLSRSVSFLFGGASYLPKNMEEYNKIKSEAGKPNFYSLYVLLRTSAKVYFLVAIATIFIIGIVGTAILWNLFEMSGHDRSLWISFALALVMSFIAMQGVKWNAFVLGTQQVAKHTQISILAAIFQLITFLIILIYDPNIIYLVIVLIIKGIVGVLIRKRMVLNLLNANVQEKPSKSVFDKGMFKTLWRSTWRLGLAQWGSFFTKSGVSIIISQIKNPALMASFLFTNKIIEFIQRIAEAPFNANMPIMYSLMAKKEYAAVKKRFSAEIFMLIIIFVVGCVAFAAFGNLLLEALSIDKSILPLPLFALYTLQLLINMHAIPHGSVYLATNQMPFYIPSLITGGLVVLFGFIVLPHYGLLGVILVQLVTILLFNAWYSTYLNLKLLHWKWYKYVIDVVVNGPRYTVDRINNFLAKRNK